MNVAHPIVLVGWLVVAAVAIVAGLRTHRRRSHAAQQLRLANADRLADSRTFRRRFVAYRLLLGTLLVATLGAFVSAAALSARVVDRDSTDPRLRVRDVMLCLDVSTSMSDADQQVLRSYERLARSFDGERIGLTIFNSAPVTVFPLTDDYDYVVRQLRVVARSFGYRTQGGVPSIYAGTVYGKTGSSLVGDGLAACLARLRDDAGARRSSSVVFATDNAVSGTPLVTLRQAAGLAQRQGVRVYGLDGSPKAGTGDANSTEFEEAMEYTDGAYFALADDESLDSIVDAVRDRQAAAVPSAPRVVDRDDPALVFVLLAICTGVALLVGWRVRR